MSDLMSAPDAVPKVFASGTHRSCPPAETLARLQPHLARFGITRVANLTGLDRLGLPVVSVCRPNARSSAVFHGKGADLIAAKVSGIMEAIETWHAENVDRPLLFGKLGDLRARANVIDVAGLPHRPGAVFSSTTPLLWIEAQDLAGAGPLWVPFEIVHAHFTVDGPPASNALAMNTNGLASGNTLPEAVSHGLCELIERDATALWRASPPHRQDDMRLDPASVTDHLCAGVLDRFERCGMRVAIWDTTTDVGVPAYQCLVEDGEEPTGHTGSGAGCHPTRSVALLRALTEAAQVRMTYIAGSREDLVAGDYRAATLRSRKRAAAAIIDRARATRDFERCPDFSFETFDTEVAWIVEQLRRVGLTRSAMIDLSRPDATVAVVRVVVPFLEGSDHDRSSYVPGARCRRLLADA